MLNDTSVASAGSYIRTCRRIRKNKKIATIRDFHQNICVNPTLLAFLKKQKLGPWWDKDFERSKVKQKSQNVTFSELAQYKICNHLSGRHLTRQQVPMVFLFLLVYLGAVAYISVEISLGSCWRRDVLRVKGQALFTNCNFLWLCVICNHQVRTTRCTTKYPWCLYFF